MNIERYRRRLLVDGKNSGEVFDNNTLSFIDSTFHESPTFRVLEVHGDEFPNVTEIDARVIEIERMGTLREILFRPRQGLNIGTYVDFDGDRWLAYDKWGSVHSADLKILVQKCNRVLSWIDRDDNEYHLDCVATATPLGSKSFQGKSDIEWNKHDVRLPIGQLFIFVEAKESTREIEMNQRFIIGRNVYEVVGIDETTLIDKEGFGVIQLTVKVTTRRYGDDFETGIAVNKYKPNGEIDEPEEVVGLTIDENIEEDEKKGGRMW